MLSGTALVAGRRCMATAARHRRLLWLSSSSLTGTQHRHQQQQLSSCRLPAHPPSDELRRRHEAVAHNVPPQSIVIVPSAPTVLMTNDIPYRFRQNSNFFYLTGLARETPAAFILITSEAQQIERTILVTKQQSASDRLWNGARMTAEEAASRCGPAVEPAYADQLEHVLGSRYARQYTPVVSSTQQHDGSFLTSILKHVPSDKTLPASRPIDRARLLKSAHEVEMMQASASIASQGFRVTMGTAHVGQNEHAIDAHLENAFRQQGASMHAYPPVVAGGSNALTLHYVENSMPVGTDDHDLVLVDAGCEYGLYCSDITRCWPVGGRFSAAQADVYNAVLRVQLKCLDALDTRTVTSLQDLHHNVFMPALEVEALQLGLLSHASPKAARATILRDLCPHAIGHYIGLDVHDTRTVPMAQSFEDGMVVTVEPGMYVPQDARFPERYRGIGVRIEDDVALVNGRSTVLSRHCPKTITDVEAALNSPSTASTTSTTS
ncbi:hypothetical protein PTSG_12918 [Salpingoeca rosetta]|uniref:Aminopeptidase P N-terminal domain-containing protein n=1 Tax=Salpingoeca rosetta (strain ATCC 50818 / BSB-021) TaxID=946362 RepID=F2UNY2_SALR5|nr:uncharacterized protein PTSG_12918 [Salpingoeca rosetta]EGD79337.1 hypothetical protein PTSG_12918 [Salpingoeca rosetta]|eukprot:XP_004989106.1 hypothetical protein PTSG_12918 [Salpingoeca rosetta]